MHFMIKTIEEIKKKAAPILKKEGIVRSSVFGSVVRGEERKDSDIDMLVEVPKGFSLFDLVGLQYKLEDILGKKVDLHTYRAIHPRLKDRILSEQVYIYGKGL